MIEARFDDLVPGAERSFRLVEPVGVLEAGRPSGGAGGPGRAPAPRPAGAGGGARPRGRGGGGHTYQVNHTIRLRATIAGDDRGFYRDLCIAQRGGYAAYLDLGRDRRLSASPQLFFRVEGVRITTRPMKGTAPRGRWLAEDGVIAGAP